MGDDVKPDPAAADNPYAAPHAAPGPELSAATQVYPPADPMRRLMAAIIDGLFLTAVFCLTAVGLGILEGMRKIGAGVGPDAHPLGALAGLCIYLVMTAAIAWNWGIHTRGQGGTLGKCRMGLAVVRGDGQSIDREVWLRIGPDVAWLLLLGILVNFCQWMKGDEPVMPTDPLTTSAALTASVLMLVKVVWVIGDYACILVGGRSLHDRLAGTVVVQVS